jgi:hypothetical protein
LELLNINIDYRNILARQKFGPVLKMLRLMNYKKKEITFDIKDVESLAKSFCNLESIEILDCELNDEIVYTLLSNLQKLSKN